MVIGNEQVLRDKLLTLYHASPIAGHVGRHGILHNLQSLFYWKGMRKDVREFVRSCVVCQANKPDLAASPRLLQPLPIQQQVWTDVSMDFIDGLPKSFNKTVIFVIVDRLSKCAHFQALSHLYTAALVA